MTMKIIQPSARALDRAAKYGLTIRDNRLVPITARRSRILQMGDNAEASMQMMQGTRNYTFDANMQLDDGTTAHAAAGWGQVGGAQSIIDLGGNQGVTITLPSIAATSTLTPQQPRIDAVCVIYVSALTLSGSDLYRLSLAASNNAGLNVAAGNVVLGQLQFGEGSAFDIPDGLTTTAPLGSGNYPAGEIYELPFTNEQYGQPYEFVSLYFSGTFGSITAAAYVAVLARE
jgi:hypothetical protein